MKKALFILIAFIGIAFGASAQRAQLQIGYGGYTQMDATDMSDGVSVNNAWGALTAGVNFQVMRPLKIGATYTFSSASIKGHDNGNAYYHVAMLNGMYDYYRNSIVKLYAHLGVGVCFTHLAHDDWKDNKTYFAFQVVPIGAEVGLSRAASMFGELGFGAQGLVQVGFRFNL